MSHRATRSLWLLSAAVAGYGASLFVLTRAWEHSPHPDAPLDPPILAFVLAFACVEVISVHLESRSEAHALTFSEIPFVAALLLADPAELMAARLVAGAFILAVVKRQNFTKLFLNLAVFVAEVATAVVVFQSLVGSRNPVAPSSWLGVFAAALAAHLLGVVAVTTAITIFSGRPSVGLIRQVLVFGTLTCLANTSIGLATVASVWERSYGGLLFLGVAAVLYLLYRAYTRLIERHKRLETLHDFTRSLGDAAEITQLEEAVAHGAREIMRAEHVALLLPPVREGVQASRLLVRAGDAIRAAVTPAQLSTDLELLLPKGESRLFVPREPLPGWLGEVGVKDAAIVPLTTDGVTVGAMVVANRLTEVSSFVEDDLRLFETLANHANVALANGRLVATLQHDAQEKAYQALHDPVTGLPNRSALQERLEQAIVTARRSELCVALVFVDLVTFKEVNDTLGIATGDRLLVEVRERIGALLPDRAELARFTGDQFAVLVTDVADHDLVLGLADQVLAAFESPFISGDVSLVLAASIGVAMYPDHASTAELLLQRADAATYRARQEGSGIEVYAADTDPYAPRRLALAADLQEALDADEVDVYVQPKLSLRDGTVVGAEALVRWDHPRLGFLAPDQFIPAAEHTGVIRQLTLYVVRNALAQCRAWRDAGHDLSVSVNLSARNLFDTHLVEDIGDAIAAVELPASLLTLELTESTVMGESHRSMTVLEGLQELGVRLSVDDFGTGYSSLTHLRSLPVTELKIDKSFVMTMTVNDQDAVIVRTLVELGRSLGLRTVAEGVESADAQALLRSYGCEEAQGYLFSRPLPAEQFTLWLERQDVRRIDLGHDVVRFPGSARRAVGDADTSR